jgi:hypothetical protein
MILLLVLLSYNPVYAHDGNNGWVTVSNYRLWSNTYNSPAIRIVARDTYYNPASCNNADSYMVSTALPASVQERIYSTLLASYFAKAAVTLYVSDAKCENGRPMILNVVME